MKIVGHESMWNNDLFLGYCNTEDTVSPYGTYMYLAQRQL